jgi:ABC-type phosphate transport system substrate-binding protein
MRRKCWLPLICLLASVSCGPRSSGPESRQLTLFSAGSTFIYPILAKWSTEYGKLHPGGPNLV